MKSIKFRAWDKPGLFMTDPFFLGSLNAGDGFDSDWEIMLFTGVTDQTGKEIFEGDIIRIENHISPVFFDPHRGCWSVLKNDMQCALYVQLPAEIIGNIYENPELLTK